MLLTRTRYIKHSWKMSVKWILQYTHRIQIANSETLFPADIPFEETEAILYDVADKLTSIGPVSCINYSKRIFSTRRIWSSIRLLRITNIFKKIKSCLQVIHTNNVRSVNGLFSKMWLLLTMVSGASVFCERWLSCSLSNSFET